MMPLLCGGAVTQGEEQRAVGATRSLLLRPELSRCALWTLPRVGALLSPARALQGMHHVGDGSEARILTRRRIAKEVAPQLVDCPRRHVADAASGGVTGAATAQRSLAAGASKSHLATSSWTAARRCGIAAPRGR